MRLARKDRDDETSERCYEDRLDPSLDDMKRCRWHYDGSDKGLKNREMRLTAFGSRPRSFPILSTMDSQILHLGAEVHMRS